MNRSFRATESKMQTALRQRNHQLLPSSFVMDKDDELALFLHMKNCENDCDDLLLRPSTEEFVDAALGKLNTTRSFLYSLLIFVTYTNFSICETILES